MELRRITRDEIQPIRSGILDVYRRAFEIGNDSEGDRRVAAFGERALDRHADYPGFRCCVAFEDSSVVGFAYGYSGGPGMYWYDKVASEMDPETVQAWLSDYFEFVEFAVLPEMQRRGIGTRIHDALLSGLEHRTAALSVKTANVTAIRFYRNHGWIPIAEDFRGFTDPYRIMGRRLR